MKCICHYLVRSAIGDILVKLDEVNDKRRDCEELLFFSFFAAYVLVNCQIKTEDEG